MKNIKTLFCLVLTVLSAQVIGQEQDGWIRLGKNAVFIKRGYANKATLLINFTKQINGLSSTTTVYGADCKNGSIGMFSSAGYADLWGKGDRVTYEDFSGRSNPYPIYATPGDLTGKIYELICSGRITS